MTTETITRDQLGAAIRKLIYETHPNEHPLTPLYKLSEWFETPINQEKVNRVRRQSWAKRATQNQRKRAKRYG